MEFLFQFLFITGIVSGVVYLIFNGAHLLIGEPLDPVTRFIGRKVNSIFDPLRRNLLSTNIKKSTFENEYSFLEDLKHIPYHLWEIKRKGSYSWDPVQAKASYQGFTFLITSKDPGCELLVKNGLKTIVHFKHDGSKTNFFKSPFRFNFSEFYLKNTSKELITYVRKLKNGTIDVNDDLKLELEFFIDTFLTTEKETTYYSKNEIFSFSYNSLGKKVEFRLFYQNRPVFLALYDNGKFMDQEIEYINGFISKTIENNLNKMNPIFKKLSSNNSANNEEKKIEEIASSFNKDVKKLDNIPGFYQKNLLLKEIYNKLTSNFEWLDDDDKYTVLHTHAKDFSQLVSSYNELTEKAKEEEAETKLFKTLQTLYDDLMKIEQRVNERKLKYFELKTSVIEKRSQ